TWRQIFLRATKVHCPPLCIRNCKNTAGCALPPSGASDHRRQRMSKSLIPADRMRSARMRYRKFGRTGWDVTEIGYGMWGMGAWSGSEDTESLGSLQRAIDLGCNFFDTAWVYGNGHSERLLEIGRASCR